MSTIRRFLTMLRSIQGKYECAASIGKDCIAIVATESKIPFLLGG